MGDFIGAIASGIAGLVEGAVRTFGDIVRGAVSSADSALPGGLLLAVVFVALLVAAWNLAKR